MPQELGNDKLLEASASDALERFRADAFSGRKMTEVEELSFRAGFMAGISAGTGIAIKMFAPKVT